MKDKIARDWYEKEAYEQTWSVRTLQRNISSQYYYRMLQTQNRNRVENEMKQLTADFQTDKLEFIKNPVIAEFLGLSSNTDFTESELESSILSNIQKFLMELGKGYAFVARQQHIKTEKQDYYIDLVFYNYILKCFVLIDLKTEKITHQDVGQMDMYIRMYDELKRSEGDNPTIGIVLCSDTDEDIARYSVMHGNEQLFASKYKLYLPTEEELRVACEKKVEHILIKGDLAKTVEKNMKQRKTRKKFMIGSVAIAGLGFIAAPFTGGASIPIAGLLAAAEEGSAVGGAAVSTIAILLAGGLGLSIITVLAGYELEYSTSDGTSIKLKPSNSKEK